MSEIFKQFSEKLAELYHYQRAMTLIDWDMYTQTPENGYADMADTLSFFSTKHFVLSTAPALLDLLEKLNEPEEYSKLDEGMQFTVKRMLRDLRKESRIPEAFVRKHVDAVSASRKAWEEAKQKADYALFAPHLQEVIDLTVERCGYTDPGKDPYRVLVDQYEEGMTPEVIEAVFEELKAGLLPLLDRILAKPHKTSRIYDGFYDIDAQKKVQKLLLSYIGFDFASGAAAESEHPFTLGFSKYDVRLTNHYHEHNPIDAMFSAIHEGGHAIFEQNVDERLKGTEADDCCYMGVHESQSRFFENILGRRKAFWIPIYGQIQELLPDLKKVSLDEFVDEINHVRCSFIRTAADEVTYCLHIILRYEMELEIFRNHRKADELPQLWNSKMQEYLHLTPEDDAKGILQDMHWSDGSFGYFPSYLLGSIYDGMFLEAMEKDLGNLDDILAAGKILDITHWLNDKIHRYGSLRLPEEVLHAVTGKELTAAPLLHYFERKYLS